MTITGTRCKSMMSERRYLPVIEGLRFVSEPVGGKPVSAIPGIGDIHANRLAEHGLTTASAVVGKFLILKKDKKAFRDWLLTILVFDEEEQLNCVCEALSKYVEAWI